MQEGVAWSTKGIEVPCRNKLLLGEWTKEYRIQ